jgi:hypothetical protein
MAEIDKEYIEVHQAKFAAEEEDHVSDNVNLIMNPSVSQ